MKKMQSAAAFTLTALVLVSCATTAAKEPQWVSKPETVYPAAQYLCAVGYSDNRKAAEEAAFASLSAYIRQDISVKSVAVEQMEQTAAGFESTYTFNRQVYTVSSIKQFAGAGIQETWNDKKGTYYALAVLSKQQTSAHYADLLQANNESINKLLTIAAQKPASFESYSAYTAAIPLAEENVIFFAILASVDPARRALLQIDQRSPVSLFIAAEQEAQKIALSIQVKGDVEQRITSAFSSIFRQFGVKVLNSTENHGYTFLCELRFESLPPTADTVFVRYSLKGSLTDTRNGKIGYTFSITDRDGHKNEAEAMQRSLRSLENYINNQFSKDLTAALTSGRQ